MIKKFFLLSLLIIFSTYNINCMKEKKESENDDIIFVNIEDSINTEDYDIEDETCDLSKKTRQLTLTEKRPLIKAKTLNLRGKKFSPQKLREAKIEITSMIVKYKIEVLDLRDNKITEIPSFLMDLLLTLKYFTRIDITPEPTRNMLENIKTTSGLLGKLKEYLKNKETTVEFIPITVDKKHQKVLPMRYSDRKKLRENKNVKTIVINKKMTIYLIPITTSGETSWKIKLVTAVGYVCSATLIGYNIYTWATNGETATPTPTPTI